MTQNYEYHPAANWYPPMDGAEYEELKASIAQNGVLNPVVLCEGMILDGRNRDRACRDLKIPCPTTQWNGECEDPYKYVVAMNSTRRHLTTAQLAEVGLRYRERFAEPAAKRKAEGRKKGGPQGGRGHKKPCVSWETQGFDHRNGGKASQQAARATGASRASIDRLRVVKAKGSEKLQAAVKAEEISLGPASKLAQRFNKHQQDEILKGGIKAVKAAIEETEKVVIDERDESERKLLGVGVLRAQEALNHLRRIPRNDPLRRRGFQIIVDWIKSNP